MRKNSSTFIILWLSALVTLTFCLIALGSFTRLTDSGLSMVDWQPLMGLIPPISERDWEEAFDLYKAYPEYQLLRSNMQLAEYKFIFWVEYAHRMLARLIGLVLVLPFLFLLVFRGVSRSLTWHWLALLSLLLIQSLAGWYMVKSGLVNQPQVSHFRLTLHLSLATIFVTYANILLYLTIKNRRMADYLRGGEKISLSKISYWIPTLWTLGFFLAVIQFFFGAFVAGLKAGLITKEYPKMFGQWIPVNQFKIDQHLFELLSSAAFVNFVHRHLGVLVALLLLLLALHEIFAKPHPLANKGVATFLALLCALQPLLGIAIVALGVPTFLAISHQIVAILLLNCILFLWHANTFPGDTRQIGQKTV